MSIEDIRTLPKLFRFLTEYWWETADLVYGDTGPTGIGRATQAFVDHLTVADVDGLLIDLLKLRATRYAPEIPDWEDPAYVAFWTISGVHRVLTRSDVDAMLAYLSKTKAS